MNDIFTQVQHALQTPMAELEEMGYEPEFSDSSIYVTIVDAVQDYNLEFVTEFEADATGTPATAVTITPEPTDNQARVIALQAALLLFDEWVTLNLMNGELGVIVRDGIASLSTAGRATHATEGVIRMAKRVRRFVHREKIRDASLGSDVVGLV